MASEQPSRPAEQTAGDDDEATEPHTGSSAGQVSEGPNSFDGAGDDLGGADSTDKSTGLPPEGAEEDDRSV